MVNHIYNLKMKNAIHQRASDKAFAKITMLNFLIKADERDLASKNYGGDISLYEFMLIVESNKTELKVWQYIAELIEKSNK
jgi:hypothetical protein